MVLHQEAMELAQPAQRIGLTAGAQGLQQFGVGIGQRVFIEIGQRVVAELVDQQAGQLGVVAVG